MRGDASAHSSGSVAEAADRLDSLLKILTGLDDTKEQNVSAIEAVLFYIGWRAGAVNARLPLTVRPRDIVVPARDIIGLIQHTRTLDQVVAEAEENL